MPVSLTVTLEVATQAVMRLHAFTHLSLLLQRDETPLLSDAAPKSQGSQGLARKWRRQNANACMACSRLASGKEAFSRKGVNGLRFWTAVGEGRTGACCARAHAWLSPKYRFSIARALGLKWRFRTVNKAWVRHQRRPSRKVDEDYLNFSVLVQVVRFFKYSIIWRYKVYFNLVL